MGSEELEWTLTYLESSGETASKNQARGGGGKQAHKQARKQGISRRQDARGTAEAR